MRTSHGRKRLPNWLLGLILIVVIAVASVLSYTKSLPWASKYEVQAVFTSAGNVRPNSQVRIAGVNVGKVTTIENLAAGDPQISEAVGPEDSETEDAATSTAAVITMQLDEKALPLHTDATMKLRPRLFLEGNLFVDLRPGSPNAPEAEDGYVFPAGQTSLAVSLDEVLTTLQSDVRTDLQILLDQLGNAFADYGGAEGLREFYRSSGGAFRYTSQVNEALLGKEPRDLSDLIVNFDSTAEALGRNEGDLQDLVTNLRIVLGSFAAESDALERGIAELPEVLRVGKPALASLNASFPAVRAFAREALPGVKSTPAALDAATPWLRQLSGLVSEDELRGLTHDLRPAIPALARLAKETIPFLRQARLVSSCTNEVIVPWSNDRVFDETTPTPSPLEPGETAKVFEELGYGLTGIAGESRSGDANGPSIKVLAGGGTNTVILPDPVQDTFGVTPLPILGALPAVDSSAKTPFRPDVRCETQDPPNLSSAVGDPPQQQPVSAPAQSNPLSTADLEQLAALGEPLADATGLLDGSTRQARKGRGQLGDLLDQLGAIGGGWRAMMTAIRKNLRNFIAVVGLFVLASGVSYYILQEQRLRIPILEEKPFQLKAEFETAQAVVPGQGQTIRVAGVRIGDVSDVELVDGRAVVTFDIERDFLPVYKDATILMRPRTGLKDMFFSLDPGTNDRALGEPYAEGDMIPMANTAPDVNLDEILAGLDGDSQAYLRTLIVGAGKGIEGRDKDLGKLLAALGPINDDLDRLSTEVAKRDDNLKNLIHNLSTLTKAVGQQDDDIARFVQASNSTLEAIGVQDPDVQQATALLPGTLRQTKEALAAAGDLGDQLGPALNDLRPFARRLPEVNAALTRLAINTTPAIRDQIRPFVRRARTVVPDLAEAGRRFSKTAPKLTKVTGKLNELVNMAAFNPNGAEAPGAANRDEGYLYWAAWLGHNSTSVFGSQDAHGLQRRIYFSASCQNLSNLITEPLNGLPIPNLETILGNVTGLGGLFAPGAVCG